MPAKPTSRLLRPIPLTLLSLVVIVGIAFIFWRLRLSHQVKSRLDEIRSAGLPVNHVEADEWYVAVPDEKNAAVVVLEAIAAMQNYPGPRSNEVRWIKPLFRTNRLSAVEREQIAGYVDMNRPALAKVQAAFTRTGSRYPADLTFGLETPLPHLARIKELAAVANQQALLAGADRPAGDLVAGIQTSLGLAATLEPEPILISQLVRFNILEFSVKTVEHRLNTDEIMAADLDELASSFAGANKSNQMARALINERAMTIPYFRMSVNEAQRLSGDPEEGDTPKGPGRMVPGSRSAVMTVSGFLERDQLLFLRALETSIALAQLPPPDCLAVEKVLDDAANEAGRRYCMISSLLLPALTKSVMKEVRVTAQLRLVTTAMAVEKFRIMEKRLPENLTELVPKFLVAIPVDPFDGAPLRYRRLEKGYSIYSIGSDRQDDGGRERPERIRSQEKISFDLTFIVER